MKSLKNKENKLIFINHLQLLLNVSKKMMSLMNTSSNSLGRLPEQIGTIIVSHYAEKRALCKQWGGIKKTS